MAKVRPKVLGIVSTKTSTGTWQPIDQLGAHVREFDTLVMADTVTSLGCVPLAIDAWGIDAGL